MFGGGGGGFAYPPTVSTRQGLLSNALLLGKARGGISIQSPSNPNAYPGQAGNPVGHAATPANIIIGGVQYSNPAYPGSLTAHSGSIPSGTPGNPTVVMFADFDGGTGGTSISGSNITFIGCRFQSNSVGFYNINNSGSNLNFSYCTVSQRVALLGNPPYFTQWGQWPSGALGGTTTSQISGTNSFSPTTAYQYGMIPSAGIGVHNLDHCDFWGFGNAISFAGSSAQFNIIDCWIHDASPGNGYHTDGPGYLNGTSGTSPTNITIHHCTIASLGNTNGIAFQQGGTRPYSNMVLTNNYFAGFGYTVDCGLPGDLGNNNWTVTDNVFATDIQAVFGPIYSNPSSMFTQTNGLNNVWRRNTVSIYPGSVPSSGSTFAFTASNNGNFIWPDSSMHTTDWPN